MPKTIDVPMLLDDGTIVNTTLWKRDFRNALYLASKPYLFEPDEILLSALEFPAVWTVECALWNQGNADAVVVKDGKDVHETFARITKAKKECHVNARRIIRRELKKHAESGHYEPSSDFKLERYRDILSTREFILVDDAGTICANAAILGFKWKIFVETCLESGILLAPGSKTVIDWCLFDILTVVEDALIRRDYGQLMGKAFDDDDDEWVKLRNETLAVSKERFLS